MTSDAGGIGIHLFNRQQFKSSIFIAGLQSQIEVIASKSNAEFSDVKTIYSGEDFTGLWVVKKNNRIFDAIYINTACPANMRGMIVPCVRRLADHL